MSRFRQAGTAILLAVALAACGSESEPEPQSKPASRFNANECRSEIGAFIDALAEIDSRLSIGLNVSELSTHLGDARVAYDGLNVEDLKGKCLRIAAKGEDVFNDYVESLNKWQECVNDLSTTDCGSLNSIQSRWSSASDQLDEIEADLET